MKIYLYVNGDITTSLGTGKSDVGDLTKMGNMDKTYKIDSSAYRQIVSACIKLVKTAQNKAIFLTITYPYYPEEQEAQKIFTNFIKNLKKTYKLEYYVWVKELGDKKGKLHYHLVGDYPYVDIRSLQKSFNSAVRNINGTVELSNNSIRLPPRGTRRTVVEDAGRMARYIGKYLSKSAKQSWQSPCYAISKRLFPLGIEIDEEIAANLIYNNDYFNRQPNEYCSITYLKNFDFYRYFT